MGVVSKIKLSHQIKKILQSQNIQSYNEDTANFIHQELIKNYNEYIEEPTETFQALTVDILRSIFNNISPDASYNDKTSSLNQSIAKGLKQLNGKRLRQNDTEDVQSSSEANNMDATKRDDINSSIREKKRKVDTLSGASKKSPFSQKSKAFQCDRPSFKFSDLAGLDPIIKQVRELVCYPLQFPEVYSRLGVKPPSGILLYGPSGCGKTALANAIAGETGLPYFKASGPELVGGTSGESEERIRQIFEDAAEAAPSVLFIDAIDVIAGKKDSSQRGMDRRIVAQFFDSIDSISTLSSLPEQSIEPSSALHVSSVAEDSNMIPKFVILIVATNKPDHVDPGVRGRFSREIALPVPDASARAKILQLHTSQMLVAPDVDFNALGKMTPGFVGADLQALAREAGMTAVCRIVQLHETTSLLNCTLEIPSETEIYVEMNDFLHAAKTIQPTAKREGFAVAPDVTWNDVGALSEVREELKHNVLEPISHPERFRALGLDVPAGVLFFGPPGCGKTLLAKAIANQSGANFISVKGPELLNMYVGESESRVRQVFARARSSAPCVIFFDELDALCPKRSSGWEGSSSGNGVSERVVNQLLTELDGLESRRDVYIIAATNRLELIDDAMLRPGRLGNLLYVPLPNVADRVSILSALTRKVSISLWSENCLDGVDLDLIARDSRADGFSGADLSALVREAGLSVIKELSVGASIEDIPTIKAHNFEAALNKVKPSVNPLDRKRYEKVQSYLKNGLSALEALKKAYDETNELHL